MPPPRREPPLFADMPSIAETRPFDCSPEPFAHCPQFVFDPILARADTAMFRLLGAARAEAPSVYQRLSEVRREGQGGPLRDT